MRKMILIILICLVFLFPAVASAEYLNDYEAEKILREVGLDKFIKNAKQITIENSEIEGKGGLCCDLPVFTLGLTEQNIYILDGSAQAYRSGQNILIKANLLNITAAYGDFQGRKSLLVAEDMQTIASKLLSLLKRNSTQTSPGAGKYDGVIGGINTFMQTRTGSPPVQYEEYEYEPTTPAVATIQCIDCKKETSAYLDYCTKCGYIFGSRGSGKAQYKFRRTYKTN